MINILHILNDGAHSGLLLFLPFITEDLRLTLTQAGFLGTLVNSLSIILALPAGYLAAKVGGLKSLVLALFVYGLGYLGTGFSINYFSLFPLFLLAGAGFGVFHPIGFALIAKVTIPQKRGKAMGSFTGVGDIGRIGIASLLTFIIVALGWRMTAIVYGAITVFLAFIFYFFLLPKKENSIPAPKNPVPVKLTEIITHDKFIYATIANFFDSFASSPLFIFLPFLLLYRGANPALLGSFSAAYFIGNFLGKTVLGRFVDRYGTVKVFIISEILMAFFILLVAGSTALPIIIVSSVILGVFTKGTAPVIQTMISHSVEHHGDFEKAFGVSQLISGCARTIAPILLGFISDKLGIASAFYTMAMVALVATIPTFLFGRTKGN